MNNSIKITIVLAWCFCLCQLAFSQGYKVKEFKFNQNDGSAFHAPNDAQGHPCGLVKVRTDATGMVFEGNVVGEVENKVNEYWVYMSKGSDRLVVKHPNFLPFVVDFHAYGIDEVSPKATYRMTLSEVKCKKEKCGLLIVAKPEQAKVYVDDVLIDNMNGNGYYQLYLPKGDHVCRIAQEGYRPIVEAVKIGKGSQVINAELESVMAELEVRCKTETAEIYVDGTFKGNGSWKGLLVAGNHQIEARQRNFNTNSRMVTLEEKESRTIAIPELKRSMGKLYITTIPTSLPVVVDGKEIGISPCLIETTTGMHYVSCNTYGCKPYRTDVEISSEQVTTVNATLEYENEWEEDLYREAYNGDARAIFLLAFYSCRDLNVGLERNPEEAVFWVNRHPDKENIVRHWRKYVEKYFDENTIWHKHDWIWVYCKLGQPEKALELFPDIQKDFGDIFSPELEMQTIGNGFYKKKDYDNAISCYLNAKEHGYEGLGDCYRAKGDKQRAASYYRKCLTDDSEYSWYNKNTIENKLRELEE